MGVFLLGLICGFAAAVAFAAYEDGESFLRLSRNVAEQVSRAVQHLPGLYQQAAGQADQIAQRMRQARANRPARSFSIAAAPVARAMAGAIAPTCPDCGTQITRQGASFCSKCGAPLPVAAIPHPGIATAFGALGEAFNLWLANPGLLLVPAQAVLVVLGWLLLAFLFFQGSVVSAVANLSSNGSPGVLSTMGIFTPWGLITWLVVIPYAYAGVAGGIIRALDGVPDSMGFLEDGLSYLPRTYLIMAIYFLMMVLMQLILGLIALVFGGFGAAVVNSPQQAVGAVFLFISAMILVSLILLIIFAPIWVMTTAGAFQDGLRGISAGFGVARAYRWPLLGTLLVLFLIGIVASVVINAVLIPLRMGAAAYDWQLLASNPSPANLAGALSAFAAQSRLFMGVYGVIMVAIYAFSLTVFLIFYRGAAYSQTPSSVGNAAPTIPASAM